VVVSRGMQESPWIPIPSGIRFPVRRLVHVPEKRNFHGCFGVCGIFSGCDEDLQIIDTYRIILRKRPGSWEPLARCFRLLSANCFTGLTLEETQAHFFLLLASGALFLGPKAR